MASIQNRNGSYKLTFCYHGKRHYLTLGKVGEQEAEAKAAAGRLPPAPHPAGARRGPARRPRRGRSSSPTARSTAKPEQGRRGEHLVAELGDRYLATHRNGAMEKNSLATVETHLDHFARTLGDGFPMASLALGDLQRHVDARAKAKYRGKPISPATIKKELSTFRAVWNWAERMGLVVGHVPDPRASSTRSRTRSRPSRRGTRSSGRSTPAG